MPAATGALFVQTGTKVCALPLVHVVETMRPLPVAPLPGVDSTVLGLVVAQGAPVPLLDLGRFVGAESDPAAPGRRYITVRVRERQVLLLVDAAHLVTDDAWRAIDRAAAR